MKIKSIVTSFSMGLVGSVFVGHLLSHSAANGDKVFAQTAACPLPADIAVTFLNSECKEVKLDTNRDFYRYFGGTVSKYGRYLTSDQYTNNVEAIQKLALDQKWGNLATTKVTVTLPSGTTVYKGIAAPQNPASCYPGGAQQTFIKDSKDPNIKWSDGQAIAVKPFSCP